MLQALRTDPELRFKFPAPSPLGGASGATLPFITTSNMSFAYVCPVCVEICLC